VSRLPQAFREGLRAAIGRQWGYVERLADQVKAKAQALGAGLVARVKLYAHAAWSMVQNATRAAHAAQGQFWERRVLGSPNTRHCPECPPLARLGWQIAGALPAIGDTVCGLKCYCRFDYAFGLAPPP
jgi:hypothetical protein